MSRHPMPCPGCRKIIDAEQRVCPHCGVDTDAMLAPLARAVAVVGVGLLLGVVCYVATAEWILALAVGAAAGVAVAWLRRS